MARERSAKAQVMIGFLYKEPCPIRPWRGRSTTTFLTKLNHRDISGERARLSRSGAGWRSGGGAGGGSDLADALGELRLKPGQLARVLALGADRGLLGQLTGAGDMG